MPTPEIPYRKEKRQDLPVVVGFQNSGSLSNKEVRELLKVGSQLWVGGHVPLSGIIYGPRSEAEKQFDLAGRCSLDLRIIFVFPPPNIDTLKHMREEIWEGMITHRLLFGPGWKETEESFDFDFEEAKKELSQGLGRIWLKLTIYHELVERWLHVNFDIAEREGLKKKMSSLSSHEDIFLRGFFGFDRPKDGRDTPKEEFCESLAMFFGTPKLLKFVNPRRYEMIGDVLAENCVIKPPAARGEG